MKSLKLIIIAAASFAIAGPAFAGRDQSQILQQEKAVQKLRAEQAKALAGPAGPQGTAGPTTQRAPASYNVGHPTERIRR